VFFKNASGVTGAIWHLASVAATGWPSRNCLLSIFAEIFKHGVLSVILKVRRINQALSDFTIAFLWFVFANV
jgi:hypothetical protein